MHCVEAAPASPDKTENLWYTCTQFKHITIKQRKNEQLLSEEEEEEEEEENDRTHKHIQYAVSTGKTEAEVRCDMSWR